jgi:hypothetical protein
VEIMDEEDMRVAWIRIVDLRWRELEAGEGRNMILGSGKCHFSICCKKHVPWSQYEKSIAIPLHMR